MRKTTLAAAIALSTTLVTPLVQAEDKRIKHQEVKSGLTFMTGTILGTIAGGPVGFILGAAGGAYLAEQGKQNVERELALEETNSIMTQLEHSLSTQELEIAQLEQMIQEKMQLQLYFDTGVDTLSDEDSAQLEALSDFLQDNDYMHITIDGHADARGSDEYNEVLSKERAANVAERLKNQGIAMERMSTQGHGARFARGSDETGYAEDRKVKVEVFSSKGSANLASTD